jgi:hypothetical protein
MNFALFTCLISLVAPMWATRWVTAYRDSDTGGKPVYIVPEGSSGSFPRLPGMAIKWHNGTIEHIGAPVKIDVGAIGGYNRPGLGGQARRTVPPPQIKVSPNYPGFKQPPLSVPQASSRSSIEPVPNPYFGKLSKTGPAAGRSSNVPPAQSVNRFCARCIYYLQ